MNKLLLLFFLGIITGCVKKAPSPIIFINKNKLKDIEKISVSVTNATSHQEITSIVEKNIQNELDKIGKYKEGEKRATLECIITEFVPIKTEVVKDEKKVSYDVHEFEETKENIKEGRGPLVGCLVDMLIPSHKIKGGEKYKYKRIIQSPIIGLEFTLRDENKEIIYQGSKLLTSESRLPLCYYTTYKDIIPEEQINSTDFIIKLAVKELLSPLR